MVKVTDAAKAGVTAMLCGLVLAVTPAYADGEENGPAVRIEANLDVVSDYRFRGVSLSGRDPAVQPSLTLTHASGAHASIWGSNIADNGGDSIELDLSAGYNFDVAGFAVDLAGVYYLYPGASSANYIEVLGSVQHPVGPATLGVQAGYVPAQGATGDRDNVYLAMTASTPLVGPLSLTGGVGWEDGAFGDGKIDWNAAIAADVGYGLSASVGYVGTHRAYNPRNADSGVVVKLSKGFGGKD